MNIDLFCQAFNAFNRKERYLVANLLYGNPTINQKDNSIIEFKFPQKHQQNALNSTFTSKIAELIKINNNYRVRAHGIDYHLDWMDAAIQIANSNCELETYKKRDNNRIALSPNNKKTSVLDSDIVIIFESEHSLRITFIEVKAFSYWSKPQLDKKITRLIEIFGEDGRKIAGVTPHFVCIDLLCSDKIPTLTVDTKIWPDWAGGKTGPSRLHFEKEIWDNSLGFAKDTEGNYFTY